MTLNDEYTKNSNLLDIRMLDAIFFDMDDTIVSYRDAVLSGLSSVKVAVPDLHNAELAGMEKNFRGLLNQSLPRLFNNEISYREDTKNRLAEILRIEGKETTDEEIASYERLFWESFWENRKMLDGASKMLDFCRELEVPIAIITNGNPQMQIRTMNKLKLHNYVDLILIPRNADEMKPSNILFERAIEILNVKRERVVMVGDSFTYDVKGSINAGITPIWFNHSQKEKTEDIAIIEVTSFPDLLNLLRPGGDGL